MGNRKYVGVAVIAAAAVLILLSFAGVSVFAGGHKLEVKAHFQDAKGLREGAPVRLAGVNVGSVQSVRVRPELRDKPAEVVMSLRTPYKLNIANDAFVLLSSAGVLGETFAEIDARSASGPPVRDGGELKTMETESMSASQMIEKLGNAVQRGPCAEKTETQKSDTSPKK